MDRSSDKKDVIKKDAFMKAISNKGEFWVNYFCGSSFEFVTERVRPVYMRELEKFHQSESFKMAMATAAKSAYDQFALDIQSKGAAALKKAGTKSASALNHSASDLKSAKSAENTGTPTQTNSQLSEGGTEPELNLGSQSSFTSTLNQSINSSGSFSILDEDLDISVEDAEKLEAEAAAKLKFKKPPKIKIESPEKKSEPLAKVSKKTDPLLKI